MSELISVEVQLTEPVFRQLQKYIDSNTKLSFDQAIEKSVCLMLMSDASKPLPNIVGRRYTELTHGRNS